MNSAWRNISAPSTAVTALKQKNRSLGAQKILREFGAAPAEAILIGDSEVDVQTARNAGTLAAAVNYGFGTHDRAAHPRTFISTASRISSRC